MITVAIIGTGFMGQTHLEVWKKIADKIFLCSTDRKNGEPLAKEHGAEFFEEYEEVLGLRPDVVDICVPTFLHYSMAKRALEEGIPVLCEKPFTLDPVQAEELCALAKEKEVLLMVAHCVRFEACYEYLRRCVEDGRFGRLERLHLYRESAVPGWSVGSWLIDVGRSGGVVRDMHIHDTDMICRIVGVPLGVSTVGNERFSSTQYRYADRIMVTASSGWRQAGSFPFSCGYDAAFERASVVCNNEAVRLYTDEGVIASPHTEDLGEFFDQDGREEAIRYFAWCLQNGRRPEICLPEESARAVRVVDAEHRSMQAGGEWISPEK